jgi:hypothetical protein
MRPLYHLGRALVWLGVRLQGGTLYEWREPGFPERVSDVELSGRGREMLARAEPRRAETVRPPPLAGSAADLVARRRGGVRG